MVPMSDRLVDMYVKTLKTEMVSKQQKKKPDMPLIGGCLRGLTSYLTQFSQSVAEGNMRILGTRMCTARTWCFTY
jgi:DNA-dependent protein kinase catalytic subunit